MQKYSEKPLNFAKLVSFDKLLHAHMVARLGKRHKKDVIDFENNLYANLIQLENELINKTYRVGEYNTFYIYEPKKREIQALSYRDRVVQHTVCDNYLTPYFKNRLIVCNCACQVGKGTTFAREKEMHEKYSKFIKNREFFEYYLMFVENNLIISKKYMHDKNQVE